jgi:hypothetical protein
MPSGPKGQKRPADVNARAVMIARIATGEIDDAEPDDGKNKAAKELGAKGGKRRAELISKEHRVEIARKGAHSRWANKSKSPVPQK